MENNSASYEDIQQSTNNNEEQQDKELTELLQLLETTNPAVRGLHHLYDF